MNLYASLIESFSRTGEPAAPAELRGRPLVAFGPYSTLGLIHLKFLKDQGARFIAAVDDYSQNAEVEGVPIIRSQHLLERRGQLPPDSVLIDFSVRQQSNRFCKQLARHGGIEFRDVVQLLACFNAASVYETVPDYRARTLARADDWLQLARRLADEHSRQTLYGVLLQRLEYDRYWINDIRIDGRDEYFGFSTGSDTFTLGNNEHFVDCGAHRGTVLSKLLSVTDWRYSSLHAFEPDAENFAALQHLMPWPIENLHVHNFAVADKPQTLRFAQTGTMGSHISEAGDVAIQCVAVDDWVETATFMKFDVEGFEAKALHGSARLLERQRPRLAVAAYHYATDLLDIAHTIDALAPGYHFYLRHHMGYFYDTILYATPRADWLPIQQAE